MQHAADLHGWTRFVSMQNQYSLLQREEEREMFGLLADQGVGSIPWSPLAKGRLARPWGEQTQRSENDAAAAAVRRRRATRRSSTPSSRSPRRAASRWPRSPWPGCCSNPVVAAPIVGPTKEHHLADAVAALDLELTDDEVAALEAPYTPRLPSGFQ